MSRVLLLLCVDVEKRRNPVCGFVTPLEGSEADSHRKPEVSCASQSKNHNYNRKISVEQQSNLDISWVVIVVSHSNGVGCVYFHLTSSGDRAGGQLLEAKDWGGDQGVSQVEDLLQEEGEHSIFNAIFQIQRMDPNQLIFDIRLDFEKPT